MKEPYIPKATEQEFCNGINLCTVRKTDEGVSKIGVKDLAGNIKEEVLETIINSDTYNGKEIIRVYASGHIFLSEDRKEVFLLTTEKDGKTQHQFTGGGPLEEENKQVIYKEDGVYKFDLKKVRGKARIRTKNRTGVKIIEEYNKKPIVDWVLMENEENGDFYYKLVCLMHFIVKKYEGVLSCTGEEYTTGGEWYNVDNLQNTKNVAPNAYIVSKKAIEMLSRLNETVIIADFSKTLTSHINPTTWSVFAKSGLLGEGYRKERDDFYKIYHDGELNGDIQKTKDWWRKHLNLFIKYGLTKKLINKITDTNYFTKREGLRKFIESINQKGIKLFLVSSGVSDFIKSFLIQNGISDDGIEIHGNDLLFDDKGKVIGYDNKTIITTLNKNEHRFDLDLYGKIILLGDDFTDLKMFTGDCLKIGFCNPDKVKGFDIYLGEDGSLDEALKEI